MIDEIDVERKCDGSISRLIGSCDCNDARDAAVVLVKAISSASIALEKIVGKKETLEILAESKKLIAQGKRYGNETI